MADDKPLSSEDMIRLAREELNLPPRSDHLELEIDFEDLEDEPDLIEEEPPVEARPSRRQRRPAKSRPVPVDPFAARSTGQPNRSAIAAGIALLLLGVGVAVLVFASAAPQP